MRPSRSFVKNIFFFLFLCAAGCLPVVLPVVLPVAASCFAKTTGRPRVLVQKDQAKQKQFQEYEILKSQFLEKITFFVGTFFHIFTFKKKFGNFCVA